MSWINPFKLTASVKLSLFLFSIVLNYHLCLPTSPLLLFIFIYSSLYLFFLLHILLLDLVLLIFRLFSSFTISSYIIFSCFLSTSFSPSPNISFCSFLLSSCPVSPFSYPPSLLPIFGFPIHTTVSAESERNKGKETDIKNAKKKIDGA
jgi:hypothetical protein